MRMIPLGQARDTPYRQLVRARRLRVPIPRLTLPPVVVCSAVAQNIT